MATKRAAKTEVVKWEEEMARQAEIAAGMEQNVAAGQFFTVRGGTLKFNDNPLPNNEMAVVILDTVLENVYYEGRYDPDVQQSPTCFAFGRDERDMAPHKNVMEAGCNVSTACDGCEMNEFGTAETGKGKACRNTRRLAMIPAGSFDKSGRFKMITEAEHYDSTAIAFMKLPVTSVKGYSAFVKSVAGALRRPPHGVIAHVQVVPDEKTQFKILFEALETLPNELLGSVMKRHEEAKTVIEFPYSLGEEDETPRSKKPARAASKKKATRRKY